LRRSAIAGSLRAFDARSISADSVKSTRKRIVHSTSALPRRGDSSCGIEKPCSPVPSRIGCTALTVLDDAASPR